MSALDMIYDTLEAYRNPITARGFICKHYDINKCRCKRWEECDPERNCDGTDLTENEKQTLELPCFEVD